MAQTADNQGNDLPAHEATWDGFQKLMLWGTIIAFGIGGGVVLLIAS